MVQYLALGVSVVLNVFLFYLVTKGQALSTADVLADLKAAVVKFKAVKSKASVDAATLDAGLPQILDLLK